MGRIQTRMGDGHRVEMTEAQVRNDLEAGTRDAAERAKIPSLTQDELHHLFEIQRRSDRVVGV